MTKKSTGKAGMCNSSTQSGSARRSTALIAALGVAGVFGVGLFGCDTAARISFPKRTFEKVESAGFTAPAGACMGVDSGEMKVRFVMLDNQDDPISLGTSVSTPEGGNISAELNSESVSFGNAALMEVHSGACAGDADCGNDPFNYSCKTPPGLSGNEYDSCLLEEAGLTTATRADSVDFIADLDNDQVFGVLVESSGSITGWNPPGTETAWDENGNGVIDGNERPEGIPQIGRDIASDPDDQAWRGINNAFKSWLAAQRIAGQDKRHTYFGLWSFNQEQDTTAYLDQDGLRGTPWAREETEIKSAISDFNSRNIAKSRANVYGAMLETIEEAYSTEAMTAIGAANPERVDKHLVVLVDGYDDLRQPSKDIDAVIEAAKANNVRVYLLHFDPQLKQPQLLRDLPRYHEDQDGNCESDADCKNYEECRELRAYQKPNSEELQEVPEGKFCMPTRDEAGRVGPIHDYARLACETDGSYIYMASAGAIEHNMSWLPYAMDGMWEATVRSSELRAKDNLGGAPVKIHTDMRVNLGGRSRNYSFSQMGAPGAASGDDDDAMDTRGVIFGN